MDQKCYFEWNGKKLENITGSEHSLSHFQLAYEKIVGKVECAGCTIRVYWW